MDKKVLTNGNIYLEKLIVNFKQEILKLTTTMFLLISSATIWISGCQTQEQKVQELVKKLQHDNPAVRVNAAWKLGEIGLGAKEAVPVLTQSLQDGNNWVCLDSAEALKKIGTPDAIKAIENSIPYLIQLLQDKDISIRGNTARTLGIIGTENAVPALVKLLQDAEGFVRSRSIEALGQIGSKDAVPALIQLLHQDQDEGICSVTTKTLKRIGTPKALKAVKEYESQ